MKTILKVIVMFGFLTTVSLAWGEIYKWVDEKGSTHFTEDPSTIPEKYRERVNSRNTEEDLVPLEQRIIQKRREEVELKERLKGERNEAEKRELMEQIKGISESIAKEKREAEIRKEEASKVSSSGYIPFDKFKYIQKGMPEAEVLSRLGNPTREEKDEVKASGTVSGGTVSGYVNPGGSFSGTLSGGSYSGDTVVVKKYYYIGDRSRGEQTRIIIIERGRVVDFKTVY